MDKHNPRLAALKELLGDLDDADVTSVVGEPEPEVVEEPEVAEAEPEIGSELSPEDAALLKEKLAELLGG